MRKIFILAIFCTGIFAFDEAEIYQKAQNYENKGDYENAMKLYKQIAQNRFQKPKNTEISTQISNDSKISVDKALPQNSYKILSKDDVEHKSESKYAQDDRLFDISVYEPFYFLGSYDFSDKDGRKNGEVKFGFGLEMRLFMIYSGLMRKSHLLTRKGRGGKSVLIARRFVRQITNLKFLYKFLLKIV